MAKRYCMSCCQVNLASIQRGLEPTAKMSLLLGIALIMGCAVKQPTLHPNLESATKEMVKELKESCEMSTPFKIAPAPIEGANNDLTAEWLTEIQTTLNGTITKTWKRVTLLERIDLPAMFDEIKLGEKHYFDPTTFPKVEGLLEGSNVLLLTKVFGSHSQSRLHAKLVGLQKAEEKIAGEIVAVGDAVYDETSQPQTRFRAGVVVPALVPGLGQALKGQWGKGGLICGAEIFSISGALLAHAESQDFDLKAENARFREERDSYRSRSDLLSKVSLLAWGIAGGVYAYNLFDAITGKSSEKEVERASGMRVQIHNRTVLANYFRSF